MNLYKSAVQKDIVKEYSKHRPFRDNLCSEEQRALEALRNIREIVIKPADKAGE